MRDGHVARAERVELAKNGERGGDRVTAPHADQRRNLSAAMNAHDVVGGAGKLERLRIRGVNAIDDVDLLDDGANGIRTLQRRRNIDGPELSAEPPLPQPRDVGVQRRRELALILPKIDLCEMILDP